MWKRGIKVVRVSDKEKRSSNEQIVMVRPFSLVINGQTVLEMNSTAKYEAELIAGYLVSNQWVPHGDALPELEKTESGYSVTLPERPPSVLDSLSDSFSISTHHIFALSAYFQEAAYLYKDTSISHSAAIASKKQLLVCCEDIHSLCAMDKAIGRCLAESIAFTDTVLLVSGKITEDMVKKALVLKIPVIISRFAPTDRAYDLATNKKMTLVGFCRGKRLSIYTGQERITVIS